MKLKNRQGHAPIKIFAMTFFRNFFASCLGTLVAFGIAFFMFFAIISSLSQMEPATTIGSNVLLELDFQGFVKDRVADQAQDPFASFADPTMGLDQILLSIEVAASDDRVKGISIKNPYFIGGMSQLQDVRNALLRFKESGKKVLAYAEVYDQKNYFLASVADSLYLNPTGYMEFQGLSSEVLYYKDFQEKTGLKMEVIRHGKYKSAVEPYLQNEMSAAQRLQLTELLEGLWNVMSVDIAASRGMELALLNKQATEMGARTPILAVENGLVDGLLFADEYEDTLKRTFGLPLPNKPKTVSLVEYSRYASTKRPYSAKENVAVVYAQGAIMPGKGNADYIGEQLTIEGIEAALKNSTVKAIVLRVNSPGGSALISDLIWRSLEKAKEEKPVVVSMGDVAASGGYYIAAAANKIFASPMTITGSIGVFGTLPNMSELASEWGIHSQRVSTHENGAQYSVFSPMTEQFRTLTKEGVEQTYQTFLSRVSQGRGMSMEAVDALAQGRVWTAQAALEAGLVDGIGDLSMAVAAAAELGGTTVYGIRNYPKYKTPFEQLVEDLSGVSARVKTALLTPNPTQDAAAFLQHMSQQIKTEGIQARMPYVLDIQ